MECLTHRLRQIVDTEPSVNLNELRIKVKANSIIKIDRENIGGFTVITDTGEFRDYSGGSLGQSYNVTELMQGQILLHTGGLDGILTYKNPGNVKKITFDGNCIDSDISNIISSMPNLVSIKITDGNNFFYLEEIKEIYSELEMLDLSRSLSVGNIIELLPVKIKELVIADTDYIYGKIEDFLNKMTEENPDFGEVTLNFYGTQVTYYGKNIAKKTFVIADGQWSEIV